MPKNKKPAGGGRAQSFEPRFAKKSGTDRFRREAPKPGSKSPNHRGYRSEDEAPSKGRWTEQERAGRDRAASIRSQGRGDARGDRATAGARGFRDDRSAGAARGFRDERGAGARDDRGYRGDRPARDDRGAGARDDRGYRGNRDNGGIGDRNRDDRGYGDRRSTNDRGYGDRRSTTDRGYGDRRTASDRPARDDRGFRDDRRPQGDRGGRDDRGFRDDRGAGRDDRRYRSDRPTSRRVDDRPRYERAGERPRYDRSDERPRYDRSDERPRFDRDSRPPRRDGFDGDRARRDDRPVRRDGDSRGYSGDRPRRDDRTSGARPNRSDWNATAKPEVQEDVVHERLEAQAVDADAVAAVSFADLGLGDNIVRALADLGAASPFPIQAATIGPILEGRDVLGRGRTGSGKTIAFGAPLVESLLRSRAGEKREFGRRPRAIVLAPTRELALQIDRTIQPIARSVGLFTTQIYGGVPQARQVGALNKGVDIVIGTPGRIEDLINQGRLDLSDIRVTVLDEADHMSELGFLEPMQRILRGVPSEAQKLLFSATLDGEVETLVREFLVEPAVYEVAGETQDSGTIEHRVLVIDHRDKAEILTNLVDRQGRTLVFARTRAYAEMLAEQFDEAGIRAVALHGDLNQAKRSRNLERLTSGRVDVLVATDEAARGIHVDDIDLVIQADQPDEYKTYLHRSGRTGRAGRSGTVVTLITRQRRRRMTELLDRAEIDAPFDEVRLGDDLLEEIAGRQIDPTA